MMRLRRLMMCLVLLGLLVTRGVSRADGPLTMTVYSSTSCDTCALVKHQVLEPLQQTYGDRLVVTVVEVSQAEGLRQLEEVEAQHGKPNNPLPVILLNNELLASEDIFELQKMLSERLEAQLGSGSEPSAVASPTAPASDTAPTAAPASTPAVASIHLVYVEKDGCSNCARAHVVLESLKAEYPSMVVRTLNDVRDADLVEAIGAHLGLPEAQRLIAPSIYVGQEALVADEITTTRLRGLLERYASTGAPAFWESLDSEAGKSSIVERFSRMGPLAVVLAGLIDGINPCAFATILFFISYLAISKRGRREMFAVGLAFTLGVFVTYLAVGLGALSLLKLVSTVRIVGLVLYSVMALTCLVLAGLSARDYVLARQGKLHDMSLNLPDKLRERIKGRIRAASHAFVGAAFVSGLMVSVLELACTGQVYLPTISFVAGIPELRGSAILYLVVYNLAFVLPLLVILVLAIYGTSTAKFEAWFVKNVARTKLVMTVLFLVLATLLIAQIVAL